MKPRPQLLDRRVLNVLWVYHDLESHVEDVKHGSYSFLKKDMYTIFICTQCPFTHCVDETFIDGLNRITGWKNVER